LPRKRHMLSEAHSGNTYVGVTEGRDHAHLRHLADAKAIDTSADVRSAGATFWEAHLGRISHISSLCSGMVSKQRHLRGSSTSWLKQVHARTQAPLRDCRMCWVSPSLHLCRCLLARHHALEPKRTPYSGWSGHSPRRYGRPCCWYAKAMASTIH